MSSGQYGLSNLSVHMSVPSKSTQITGGNCNTEGDSLSDIGEKAQGLGRHMFEGGQDVRDNRSIREEDRSDEGSHWQVYQ